MNMYRGTDEFIIEALRKERGLLGRLILALRVMFIAPKGQQGGWADGARGVDGRRHDVRRAG